MSKTNRVQRRQAPEEAYKKRLRKRLCGVCGLVYEADDVVYDPRVGYVCLSCA